MTESVDASTGTTSFGLLALPPLHLEATVRTLQRRPANRVDRWEQGCYMRVLATGEGLRLIAVENRGTIEAPHLRCLVSGGAISAHTRHQVCTALQRLLGVTVDLAPFYGLAAHDPPLHAATVALRGLKPPRFATLFETIANVIPFQQVSLAAGVAIVARLVDRFGQRLELGDQTYVAFPEPAPVAQADAHELRSLGLSRTKAHTLRTLAQQVLSGELSEDRLAALPSAAAMTDLTALPGIGPWSAGLILLRGFRRMEIFPEGDVGAARNVGQLLEIDGALRGDALRSLRARLGSEQGYLYFYALGCRLLREGLITPARTLT